MDGDGDQLLRQIIDDPDNDDPRLVYADWLSDHGDPRGEFIAIQCYLANCHDTDPSLPDLERRQNDLHRTHSRDWRLPGRYPQVFERGFVTNVFCPKYGTKSKPKNPAKFESVCSSQPLVTFQDWPAWEGDHVQQIHNLIYSQWQLLHRLLRRKPWPPQLRQLRIDFYPAADTLLQLANCPQLQQLEQLRVVLPYFLPDNFLLDFMDVIAPETELQVETHLAEEFSEFLERCGPRALRLDVKNGLDIAATRPLLLLPEDKSPQILEVCFLFVGLATQRNELQRLFKKPCMRELESLSFSMRGRGDKDFDLSDVLKDAPILETVRELNLEFNCLDDECHLEAAIDLPWTQLTRLKVRSFHAFRQIPNYQEPTPPTPAPQHPVVRMLQRPPATLRRLDLRHCQLTDDVLEAMLSVSGIEQLTHLDLAKNRLTNRSGDLLLSRGPWPNLVALDLRHNSLDNATKERLVDNFGNRIWQISR